MNDQEFATFEEAKAHYENNGGKFWGTIFKKGEGAFVLVESVLPLGEGCFQVVALKWELVANKPLSSAAWVTW